MNVNEYGSVHLIFHSRVRWVWGCIREPSLSHRVREYSLHKVFIFTKNCVNTGRDGPGYARADVTGVVKLPDCTAVDRCSDSIPAHMLREPTCSSANRDRAGVASPVQAGGSGLT